MKQIEVDLTPPQATADFTLKLSQDMVKLLERSMSVMQLEIGMRESINVVLSVLALAGVSTANGSGGEPGTFEKYAKLAEELMRSRKPR